MTHCIFGALAFAGLIGAQFMAAIVLTGKPAEREPGGPAPCRAALTPQQRDRLLRSARA